MSAADPEAVETTIYEEVDIAAAPEEVFRALTDPRELEEWWGSHETHRTRTWRVDARPGGEWSVRTTDADGNESTVEGEYLVVEPPRRLEYTWRNSRDGFAPTRVRYDLAPVEVDGVPGTRVSVSHTGINPATPCACLDRLADHVLGSATAVGYSGGWTW